MKLIEFDGVEFKIADEALLIRPVRELFLKDKTNRKEEFWKQISYLWFMCDPRSTYQYIIDADERSKEILKQEGLGEDWTPSDLLKEAMDCYRKQSITTSALLLEGMRKGIEKVRNFLENVDLFQMNEKTNTPVYQVSTITNALKQVPELAKALIEAERELAKDYESEDKARGNAQKSVGEDI